MAATVNRVSLFALPEVMAIRGLEGHAVERFELLDFLEGLRREGRFAFEGVKDDAFEQIAERHILLFGDGLEDLEHAFFKANAGLDALDFNGGWSCFSCDMRTNVPKYISVHKW